MTTFIQTLTVEQVFQWVGVDPQAVLSRRHGEKQSEWSVVTNLPTRDSQIESSAFYRSVISEVDDKTKRANFSVMINELFSASRSQNYKAVLQGSAIKDKVAWKYDYLGAPRKIFELKKGKQDRIYYSEAILKINGVDKRLIVLMQSLYKKDQTTPQKIINHCEKVMHDFYCRPHQIELKRS